MTKDGRSEGAERLSVLNEDVPDALRPANLGLSSAEEDPDPRRETGEATPDGAERPETESRPGPGPDLDNTD